MTSQNWISDTNVLFPFPTFYAILYLSTTRSKLRVVDPRGSGQIGQMDMQACPLNSLLAGIKGVPEGLHEYRSKK